MILGLDQGLSQHLFFYHGMFTACPFKVVGVQGHSFFSGEDEKALLSPLRGGKLQHVSSCT